VGAIDRRARGYGWFVVVVDEGWGAGVVEGVGRVVVEVDGIDVVVGASKVVVVGAAGVDVVGASKVVVVGGVQVLVVVTGGAIWSGAETFAAQPKFDNTVCRVPVLPSAK